MKIFYPCTLLVITGLLASSCKKFVTIPPPSTQPESTHIFENNQAATSAALGLYSQMMQTFPSISSGGITVYAGLSADEIYNTATNLTYDVFRSNQLLPTTTDHFWATAYRIIYHANAVMEGLSRSSTIGDSLKRQLRGEMLIVRAFTGLNLVNLFGDVPIVKTTSFEETQSLPRAPAPEVYQSVLSDLEEAKDLLRESYSSAGRARPNKWTAIALLARVHLYLQNWTVAETLATAVIDAGIYNLPANLNNVFLTNSTEAIWQLSPVSTTLNTHEGNAFIPSSATSRPTFAITSSLMNAFETNDQRKTSWLKSTVVSAQTYFYPFKYKIKSVPPPYTEYFMVLRLAEQYLIRSEARAMQNNIVGSQNDLNKIRNRAGLPNTLAGTQELILVAIANERRIELMAEWGHRWFDLRRTGKSDEQLGPLKGATWQSTDVLYPVPQTELDRNPFLVQNLGY